MQNINKYIIPISLCLVLIACSLKKENKDSKKNSSTDTKDIIVTKSDVANTLENIKEGELINLLDLSSKALTEIPDLSKFSIKKLDLSNNNITLFEPEKFPKNLENLNLKNNKLNKVYMNYKDSLLLNLKKIDLSHNKIEKIILSNSPVEIYASNNNLAYHPNMPNVVDFDADMIETVKRNNISNNKPLIATWKQKPKVNRGYQVKVTKEEERLINKNIKNKK